MNWELQNKVVIRNITKFRSRHQRFSIKKAFLKKISQENNCIEVSFYLKETPTEVFPVNIAKLLSERSLKNICELLLQLTGIGIVEKYSICHTLRKKCQYSKFFWFVFSHIRIKYGEIPSIFPFLALMRENTDQRNSVYRHFFTQWQ